MREEESWSTLWIETLWYIILLYPSSNKSSKIFAFLMLLLYLASTLSRTRDRTDGPVVPLQQLCEVFRLCVHGSPFLGQAWCSFYPTGSRLTESDEPKTMAFFCLSPQITSSDKHQNGPKWSTGNTLPDKEWNNPFRSS